MVESAGSTRASFQPPPFSQASFVIFANATNAYQYRRQAAMHRIAFL
ncbi:hypothetical protein Leryth_016516 [Lithospermum erythrorhizon]|nr:hypothetical protein Leryth_016516 [Lithospermum erythrorhizon]